MEENNKKFKMKTPNTHLKSDKKHKFKIYADGSSFFIFIDDGEKSIKYTIRDYFIGMIDFSIPPIPGYKDSTITLYCPDEKFSVEYKDTPKEEVDYKLKKVFKEMSFYKTKLEQNLKNKQLEHKNGTRK